MSPHVAFPLVNNTNSNGLSVFFFFFFNKLPRLFRKCNIRMGLLRIFGFAAKTEQRPILHVVH